MLQRFPPRRNVGPRGLLDLGPLIAGPLRSAARGTSVISTKRGVLRRALALLKTPRPSAVGDLARPRRPRAAERRAYARSFRWERPLFYRKNRRAVPGGFRLVGLDPLATRRGVLLCKTPRPSAAGALARPRRPRARQPQGIRAGAGAGHSRWGWRRKGRFSIGKNAGRCPAVLGWRGFRCGPDRTGVGARHQAQQNTQKIGWTVVI